MATTLSIDAFSSWVCDSQENKKKKKMSKYVNYDQLISSRPTMQNWRNLYMAGIWVWMILKPTIIIQQWLDNSEWHRRVQVYQMEESEKYDELTTAYLRIENENGVGSTSKPLRTPGQKLTGGPHPLNGLLLKGGKWAPETKILTPYFRGVVVVKCSNETAVTVRPTKHLDCTPDKYSRRNAILCANSDMQWKLFINCIYDSDRGSPWQ